MPTTINKLLTTYGTIFDFNHRTSDKPVIKNFNYFLGILLNILLSPRNNKLFPYNSRIVVH